MFQLVSIQRAVECKEAAVDASPPCPTYHLVKEAMDVVFAIRSSIVHKLFQVDFDLSF